MRAQLLLPLVSICSGTLAGQAVISPSQPERVVLKANIEAMMNLHELRRDLPCDVTPMKPEIGFNLMFHAGFEVGTPLSQLKGTDTLTIVFRVKPKDGDPVYFNQKMRIPAIGDLGRGKAYVKGWFDVGEGIYEVDWVMWDRGERVCSAYWTLDAIPSGKDKGMICSVPSSTVHAAELDPFRHEPEPKARGSLRLKILLNASPVDDSFALFQRTEIDLLVAVLRMISRDPHVGALSIVAYNVREQRVIWR